MSTAYILLSILLVSVAWNVFRGVWSKGTKPVVALVVLGDIGRSPRMMYHADSFAENGFETYLVGYRGAQVIESLRSRTNVHMVHLPETPRSILGLPFIIFGPLKVCFQVLAIIRALLVRVAHRPDFVVVQNPPSIPTLAIVWLVCKIRGSKLVIDWHNLGYSILAIRLGQNHIFVKVAKAFESFFGKVAYLHLFVTEAMKDHLSKEWGLKGHKVVFHDRPPSHFHRLTPPESHQLFTKLCNAGAFDSQPRLSFVPRFETPHTTPFTIVDAPRPDRPALLVSSTSWTPDEDFGILLEALCAYEDQARAREADAERKLPKVLMVITGKGPLKEKFMASVAKYQEERKWEWVHCMTMWLEAGDYPLLLGSADLGISLHSSSSGLDLPMKVVDMFGSGLPVCALDYPCLSELVLHDQNGLTFKSSEELVGHLVDLLGGFPDAPKLGRMGEFVGSRLEWCSWKENWDKCLKPLITID